jgi:hypothetical protein
MNFYLCLSALSCGSVIQIPRSIAQKQIFDAQFQIGVPIKIAGHNFTAVRFFACVYDFDR